MKLIFLPVCSFAREQVRELCTNYVEIHGFWWDANYLPNVGIASPQLPVLPPVSHWRHPGMLPKLPGEITEVVEYTLMHNLFYRKSIHIFCNIVPEFRVLIFSNRT